MRHKLKHKKIVALACICTLAVAGAAGCYLTKESVNTEKLKLLMETDTDGNEVIVEIWMLQ